MVRNVGDEAIGVLCTKCTADSEKWAIYEAWKREHRRPRRARKPRVKDELDREIEEIERQIKDIT